MSKTYDTTNVKVRVLPVVDFLIENKDKKVSTIIDDVIALASTKQRSKKPAKPLAIRDDADNVVGIFDGYYKRWMPVIGQEAVEFGVKASSNTGYNAMCKEGQNLWTKANTQARNILSSTLDKVIAGEITAEEAAQQKATAASIKAEIVHTDKGFDTLAELYSYLANEGVTLQEGSPEA